MKTLSTVRDLEQYGLSFLTGEACALMHRFLFDMNEDGIALVTEYFGMQHNGVSTTLSFPGPWNSKVNGKPAIASIMLPRNPEFYRDLFKFLLFREEYEIVVQDLDAMIGMSQAEYREYSDIECLDGFWRNPRNPAQPSVGTRNIHAMTERVL